MRRDETVIARVGVSIMRDGSSLPVVEWLDAVGKACEPAVAAECVCGPDDLGRVWIVDLTGSEWRREG